MRDYSKRKLEPKERRRKMNNTDTLIEQCEKLIKEFEENLSLVHGSALQVTNEEDFANIYLTPKAKAAISKISKNLTHKDETGTYTCIYLGVQTRTDKIEKAVEAICENLNRLADQDLIHSCLAPPSSLPLAKMPMQMNTSVVIAYVLVPEHRKKDAEELAKFVIEEGGLGTELMSLEADLKEDEFFAEISLSHNLAGNGKNSEERLHSRIGEFINVLPPGTEVVEVVPCAIVSLSLPFEVRFRNPLMKEYREVRLNYRRECVRVGEDKIEQFNLLTSVEYIRKDGK